MTFFKFIIANVSFQIVKWFLQRLEKAVASFTDSVRPVCLAVPDFIDYPPCPDVSLVVVLLLSNKIMGFDQTFKPSRQSLSGIPLEKKSFFPKATKWHLPKCPISQVTPSQMSNFPSDTFPNVQFPKKHLPKCPISQVTPSQTLGFFPEAFSRSSRTSLQSRRRLQWGGPSAVARTDLGSCRLGKCLWYPTS